MISKDIFFKKDDSDVGNTIQQTKTTNVAWKRKFEITLTNNNKNSKPFVIADYGDGENALDIKINGDKYLSCLKDTCTIEIINLTYDVIVSIIAYKYFDIEVKVGYKNNNFITMFKGSIIYISNALTDGKTNKMTIFCGSKLIASYGQLKMNLTLTSGINMFTALKFLFNRMGIKEYYLNDDLKKIGLSQELIVSSSSTTWLDDLMKSKGLLCNVDYSNGNIISVWKNNGRLIKLENKNILLDGGYPTLSSEGLDLSVFPTFKFSPGDIIELDNSIININVSSLSEISQNYSYRLDIQDNKTTGQYVIYKINYVLENRGNDFVININAKSKSILKNFLGGK